MIEGDDTYVIIIIASPVFAGHHCVGCSPVQSKKRKSLCANCSSVGGMFQPVSITMQRSWRPVLNQQEPMHLPKSYELQTFATCSGDIPWSRWVILRKNRPLCKWSYLRLLKYVTSDVIRPQQYLKASVEISILALSTVRETAVSSSYHSAACDEAAGANTTCICGIVTLLD